MEEIELKKFDMKNVMKDSVCCFIASRRSGKSFLIKDLLYHHQTIPAGIVISKTDKLCHYYDQFIPPCLIYDQYDPEIMDKLFARQKKAVEEKWANPNCFLIFDDTLSDAGTWKKDERVKEIFFNGRHYKILFLLTMQAPMGITSDLRGNIDFTFILQNNNTLHRKNLYENYAGMFPTREIFEKVLDACTEDYGCLVIDNSKKTNKLEEQVFYYKASSHEDYKMCSNSFWQKTNKSSKTHYNEDTETRQYKLKSTYNKDKNLTIRKL